MNVGRVLLLLMMIVSPAAAQTAPAAPAARPSVRPLAFQGRGIYYFAGRVPCPLAGVGKRPADDSNRVALDDEHTQVIVDRTARRIVVRNDHNYPDKAIIADLMFLAQARTQAGETVPAAVHVKLEKKGDEVEADVHPHWTVRDKLTSATLEVFDIALAQRQGDKVVVRAGDLLRTAVDSKILYQVAGRVIEIKDNRAKAGAPTLGKGTTLADLSLGFGSRILSKMLVRMQVVSTDDANKALRGQPLRDLLVKGAWELRLTAESSLLSQETLRRDLFMLGLDRLPVVAAGMQRGLKKGETLTFAFHGGQGQVTWGKPAAGGTHSEPLPEALDVARAFLEFNFLGAVLGRQVAQAAPASRTSQ
jgi:hypothetical protein